MILYIARFVWYGLWHPRIALMGFREGDGDMGMTYDNPTSSKSIAYDFGRTMKRRDW